MRHLSLITALAGACVPIAGPASQAGDIAAAAKLERPMERPKRIVAGEHVWRCDGDTCRGMAGANPSARAKICRRLAKQAGKLLSFEAGGRAFGGSELAECNR